MLLCLLDHKILLLHSTTRLYASIQIGFSRCCYSALKQIQSISFSYSHRQLCNKQREKEKYPLMFIYSSFLSFLILSLCIRMCVHYNRSIACMQSTMTMLTSDHIHINQSWLFTRRMCRCQLAQSRQIML